MKRGIWGLAAILVVVVVAVSGCGGRKGSTPPTSIPTPAASSTANARLGPAVDKIEFSQHHVDQALASLQSGKIDLYLFGLKLSAARELDKNAQLKSYRAPASTVTLLMNPAPARAGELNPFSISEVRQAMNFLIDRKYIADEVYGGYAEPMVAPHVGKFDYDYLTVLDVIARQNVRYDLDYAKSLIEKAMKQAGAEFVGGRWQYRGRSVELKFVIRTEDERKNTGDLISRALEQVGFTVRTVYKDFAAAISTVYSSDPSVFEWHLYTEGWGRGASEKYDFATINQMGAPWMSNMPGWQIFGFWQYQNAKLDEIGKKLLTGDFASREERDRLYREATELVLSDRVRLGVVTVFNTFPARLDVTGVTEDLVAGPKGILTLREAYVPGKSVLKIGNLWVWTQGSVWNPVAGFEDVYSTDIWKNIVDPALISHPFSGIPIPFRVKFDVQTAGSQGAMDVPAEAVMWDAATDQWNNVSSGTKAKSKVTFDFSKYFQSKWHHGEALTMADVLYSIASLFERTYDSKKRQVEYVLAVTQKPILDVFRGFRVLDNNRFEVYLDYWHFETSYIASYANVASLSMPWEVLAAMDNLVFDKKMAVYSKGAAARWTLPQISLAVRGGNGGAKLVIDEIRGFEKAQRIPAGVFSIGPKNFVEMPAAIARYQAALKWFDTYQLLVISNGPFMLTRYDPAAQYAELTAFRDSGYPFKQGDWYMAKPGEIQLSRVNVPGRVDVANVNVITANVTGPGRLGVNYFVVDSTTGALVASGQATKDPSGNSFRIEIQGNAFASFRGKTLDLYVLAYSDAVILVKEQYRRLSVP